MLGLTFRPDVAVTAHTNAVGLREAFEARGAAVWGHDPLLSEQGIRSLGFEPAEGPFDRYDLAVVHAYHAAYAALDWPVIAPVLLDARNAMDRAALEGAGIRYVGIGRPLVMA